MKERKEGKQEEEEEHQEWRRQQGMNKCSFPAGSIGKKSENTAFFLLSTVVDSMVGTVSRKSRRVGGSWTCGEFGDDGRP
jgi:hypothetical protein